MNAKYSILSKYWGYSSFRPDQEEIIDAVLSGKDVLALLPTGGGKSLCFQLPALMNDGLCVVVTPLIALMQDQVEQLTSKGIKAEIINSSMGNREIDNRLDNCVYGDVKFLYLSPERLTTDLFQERVQKMKVNLVAVDEAHCISQWGYDFRRAYLKIAELRVLVPDAPVIALTATATKQVQVDICEKLEFRNHAIFQQSYARPNLSYSVRAIDDKEKKLISVLKTVPGSAIIYVNTRKSTKELSTLLFKNGISSDFYHAGLAHDERSKKQTNWIRNQKRVIVATNAFGMGIDKADVRLVIHFNLPQNLESYYQEAGRAGRNGKKAFGLIIYNQADIKQILEKLILQYPEIDFIKRVYQSLANYYSLAVGSGGDINYDFDIHEFSENFNLNHLEVYYAIKKLEEEQLVNLNESFYAPSKVKFEIDNKELYEFQVANASYDSLIKALLRMYGGELFTQYLTISEKQVAKFLETTELTIIEALKKLEQFSILSFLIKKDSPQISFIKERYAVETLPLSQKNLQERKDIAQSKIESIISYTQNSERCRTAQLLNYFGEMEYDRCGVCDVCISNRKSDHMHERAHYREQINAIIENKDWVIDELVEEINPKNQEDFLETLRQMVDSGELVYDDRWQLKRG